MKQLLQTHAAVFALLLVAAGCTPPIKTAYVVLPAGGAMGNADSVRTAWNSLSLGASKQFMRRGLNCNGCMVPVDIAPVEGEETFDPSDPPAAPRAVAHVVNKGAVATEMYGLQPDADDYFVVARDSLGKAMWSIVSIPKQAHGTVTVFKGRGVQGCHHKKADKPAAAFQTCDGAQHASEGGRPSLMQLASRGVDWLIGTVLRINAEDPAWIACTDGCCTMDTSAS